MIFEMAIKKKWKKGDGLNDLSIRAWIKADERFEGRGDKLAQSLVLSFRPQDKLPRWLFRYSFERTPRKVVIGNYGNMSLSEAREKARELGARVQLGYDVQGDKKARQADALAKIEADKLAMTVNELADEYFAREVVNRVKHSNIQRGQIEKNIRPIIGGLIVQNVTALHVDEVLEAIKKRGAPSVANKVLRLMQCIFDYAIRRHMVAVNPAGAFRIKDAGGSEKTRDRALSRTEIALLFAAMKQAKGFSNQNALTIKLLLLLCCRKMELCAARWEEFDLERGIWYMRDDVKMGAGLDIPLPVCAVEWLQELKRLSGASPYVLPVRKMQTRGTPHISESTMGVALGKLLACMPESERFTIHDLRRTARTQLAALGIDPITAERCLNHKIKGVQGIYDRHDYFEERKAALDQWAALLDDIEHGNNKVFVLASKRRKAA